MLIMAHSDVLSNFKVGDTVTLQNPRTGKIDMEISVERIINIGSKKYYTLKLASRLYDNPKYISRSENTRLSDIIGGLYSHYTDMTVEEV